MANLNIEIVNLNFNFSDQRIFENLNITFKRNRVTAILGPSGCGKTTLLNLISGIILPLSGSIEIPENIKYSHVFQESRLLSWKNVEDNIKFVLKSLNKEDVNFRINHYLSEMELLDFKKYYPFQLSGGMKQRVSIARAFAYPSNTIIMDEPFKGLDPSLKSSLIKLFNKVWREDERTAIFVTHDINEALMMGDDIMVLSKSPNKIIETITNPLPWSERDLNRNEIISIEKKLYKLLI
ncbi:MAG: ABC transporter ATP-binding protein [Spirochaetales bacterium]|nr:ABC transporter ATP-binding protein [Spirochaetales bacterium]